MYGAKEVTFEKAFKYGGLGIKTQPKDAAVNLKEEATFTVEAVGGKMPYTYTWQRKNQNGDWDNLGNNANTLKTTPRNYEECQFRCVIRDANRNSVTSDVATLTVKAPDVEKLTIYRQPKDATVVPGEEATLEVQVTGGHVPYTYSWKIVKIENQGVPRPVANPHLGTHSNTGSNTDTIKYSANANQDVKIQCEITDAQGTTVKSEIATVSIKGTPFSIKTQPKDVTAAVGQKATLTVEVTGGKAPYTYTWERPATRAGAWLTIENGTYFSGQGTQTLTYTSNTVEVQEIRCKITDANGVITLTSNTAKVTTTDELSIKTQPKDVTVVAGEKVTLTVEAVGGKTPYTYTWQAPNGRTWKDIPIISTAGGPTGQGTKSLIFSSSIFSKTTSVRCVVKDAKGNTVTSDVATITVQETTAPLSIKTQPKDVTVETGKKGILTVEAAGGKAPYTYTWQMPSGSKWVDVSNSSMFSGQGTNTFTVLLDIAGSVRARCVIKDANGKTVTSNEATVTITEPLKIKTQPKDVTVDVGKQATLTVAASGGTTPYTYNWRVNADGRIWLDIQNSSGYAGQGTNTLTYTPNLAGTYTIHCVVKDANGNSVTSNTVNITVNAKNDPLSIATHPMSVTVEAGQTTVFGVVAVGGKAPYIYKWQTQTARGEWSDIKEGPQFFGPQFLGQGRNSLLCMTTNVTEGAIKLRCVVKDANGNEVISDIATLTVKAKVAPLVITMQPVDATVDVGGNTGVAVEVSGGKAPYTYTWETLNGGNWAMFSQASHFFGQGTNALIFAPNRAGYVIVRCVIRDSAGQTVTSNSATLTAKAPAPLTVKIAQPKDVTVEAGETVRLTVEARGGKAPYTYAWKVFNGAYWIGFPDSDWREGGRTATLSYTPGIVGTDEYHCVVTDSDGNTVTSETFTVTVKPLAVQINNGAEKYTLSYRKGETVMLRANATGGVGPYTCTWYVDGFNESTLTYGWIPVHTGSSYEVGPGYSHEIRLEVKDAEGTIVTTSVWIEVTDTIN